MQDPRHKAGPKGDTATPSLGPETPEPPSPTALRRVGIGIVILLAIALLLEIIVVPLFSTVSGSDRTVIGGKLPSRATTGQPLAITLSVDNTYGPNLIPVCIAVGPATDFAAVTMRIQGGTLIHFQKGIGCGQELIAGETVSLQLTVLPSHPGKLPFFVGAVTRSGQAAGPRSSTMVTVSGR